MGQGKSRTPLDPPLLGVWVHLGDGPSLKGSRWALLKSPPNLTAGQRTTLAGIAKANGGLYRAYPGDRAGDARER